MNGNSEYSVEARSMEVVVSPPSPAEAVQKMK
jgi:hypothetical protein